MMGWHGSAMTAGSAVGAPLAGFAIDLGGWRWGFLVVSAVGVLVAGPACSAGPATARTRASVAPEPPDGSAARPARRSRLARFGVGRAGC